MIKPWKEVLILSFILKAGDGWQVLVTPRIHIELTEKETISLKLHLVNLKIYLNQIACK